MVGPAESTGPSVDPEQQYCRIVGGGAGILYTVRSDGVLQWWRHLGWQTGAATWANAGGPRPIGTGWHRFVTVLGGTDGSLFGVDGNGDVVRYRYVLTDAATGAGYWENRGAGVTVGSGFDRFPRVFGGPDGVVWGADEHGDLFRSGYSGGALTDPAPLGGGFQDAAWLGADSGGVIYGVLRGALVWWRWVGGSWQHGGQPIPLGDGWGDLLYRELCAAGAGLFYFVRPDAGQVPRHDDTLAWSYLTNYQSVAAGGPVWAHHGVSTVVGQGFTVERWAPLQGYADPQCVAIGDAVDIAASTTFPTVSASIVRVAPAAGDPETVWGPQEVPGRLQLLPEGYRSAGCGWSSLLQVPIPGDWPSGLYAARLEGPSGLRRHVPFVVRPPQPVADLAVLLPTASYHAYNGWGGHNQYSPDMLGAPRTFTFRRPSYAMTIDNAGVLNHGLYSDLLLLQWLSREQIPFDCYIDQDLQRSAAWLSSYRALLLGSHPEYYSPQMRQAVADFVASGGRLICPGGNAIYEPVDFSADLTAATFREPDGDRHPYGTTGLPESQILGVSYTDAGWMTFAPYAVVRDHPILAGTGLAVGSVVGATGYNHAASGWEFDVVDGADGSATPDEVVAVGQNPAATGGAAMVFIDKPNGGFVFGANSISFVGALQYDAQLSQLFRNVVDRAVAPNPLRAATPVAMPRRAIAPSRAAPRYENAGP